MKRTNLLILPFLFSIYTAHAQQENVVPAIGNVGIGTTTPAEKLEVNGNALITEDVTVAGNTSMQAAAVAADLKVDGNIIYGGAQYVANGSIFPFIVMDVSKTLKAQTPAQVNSVLYNFATCSPNSPTWANGLNKIYVNCPLINVGIRTDSPRVPLDVIGAASVGTLSIGMDPAAATAMFHLKSGTYAGPIFTVENTTRKLFQIRGDGLILAREIKLDLVAWPDYVFKSDYKLMPLSEVERYIETAGHLPNVPSAATVEGEGLNVAEMNKVLMEKIEELTLHLIEQDKRIKQLEAAQQH